MLTPVNEPVVRAGFTRLSGLEVLVAELMFILVHRKFVGAHRWNKLWKRKMQKWECTVCRTEKDQMVINGCIIMEFAVELDISDGWTGRQLGFTKMYHSLSNIV